MLLDNFEQITRILIIPRSSNKLGGLFASVPARPAIFAICNYNRKGTGFGDDEFAAEKMREKYTIIKAAVAAGKLINGGKIKQYGGFQVKSFDCSSKITNKGSHD